MREACGSWAMLSLDAPFFDKTWRPGEIEEMK